LIGYFLYGPRFPELDRSSITISARSITDHMPPAILSLPRRDPHDMNGIADHVVGRFEAGIPPQAAGYSRAASFALRPGAVVTVIERRPHRLPTSFNEAAALKAAEDGKTSYRFHSLLNRDVFGGGRGTSA
jgi:hypothetical protein